MEMQEKIPGATRKTRLFSKKLLCILYKDIDLGISPGLTAFDAIGKSPP
jgi:hypothetical protein